MKLVNPAALSVTPSSRRWSSPWLDASIAAWVMPFPAASASVRCRVIGSGVVCPKGAAHAPSTPVVPRFTAGNPISTQIWRTKVETEVFPLVPVTAIIMAGWPPNHSAAVRASASRGESETTSAASEPANSSAASFAPAASVSTAAAPIRRAY